MSERFSPQAVKVMRELAKSSKPMDFEGLDKAKINLLLKIDSANEVLIRHADGKIAITRKAIQKIFELIAGFEIDEGVAVERTPLRLVYSAPEKANKSDKQDSKPEDLSEGQETQ